VFGYSEKLYVKYEKNNPSLKIRHYKKLKTEEIRYAILGITTQAAVSYPKAVYLVLNKINLMMYRLSIFILLLMLNNYLTAQKSPL